MTTNFIGREPELEALKEQINSNNSAFIALFGRRRIGKTETILYFCEKEKIKYIEFTGRFEQPRNIQIKAFLAEIARFNPKFRGRKAEDWFDAFEILKECLNDFPHNETLVIFIDELPWMDTQRSGLLAEIGDFWNKYASRRPGVSLVVCGSAASYMLKKVIKNKGPLHNRLTRKIPMEQFDLYDTKRFLEAKGFTHYNNKAFANIYMALGGVAKYLIELNKHYTPQQAIQGICFSKHALLKGEYEELYQSLFRHPEHHYKIMTTLTSRWSGLTKSELAEKLKVSNGHITKTLEELIGSGFVAEYTKLGHVNRENIYVATDFFSYFHNRWMTGKNKSENWNQSSNSQEYAVWSGYTFEKLCHSHVEQIKASIGISGIPTSSHYWSYRAKNKQEKGAQIDLLLSHEGRSRNIEIIECKYYDGIFTITESYKKELINKKVVFNEQTGHKYNTRFVIVTTEGVTQNDHFNELNPIVVTLNDLFLQTTRS
jgi:AAA+ ATPase superfamily predicted ATPase